MTRAETAATARGSRVSALDGLRGVTIVLVVLGHGSLMMWPGAAVLDVPYLRGFFLGGTVTVFFIVGGYVVTRGLLRELDEGTCDPWRFYARRLVRLGPQLLLLCIAVMVLASLDDDGGSVRDAWRSVLHVATYTWNVFLEDSVLSARGDLGHLWYLSVQQQVYVVLPLFLALFARTRRIAVALLLSGIVLAIFLRFHWLAEIGYWPVSLRALTRWDGLLLGILLALVLPAVRGARRWVPPAFACSVLAFLALVLIAGESGGLAYLRWWGVGVLIVSGALVGLIVLHPGGWSIRALGTGPLAAAGRASYSIYLWHYPVFWFLSTHAHDWYWYSRVVAALLVLVPLVVLMERFVETPTRRLLAESAFFRVGPSDAPTPAAGAGRVAL